MAPTRASSPKRAPSPKRAASPKRASSPKRAPPPEKEDDQAVHVHINSAGDEYKLYKLDKLYFYSKSQPSAKGAVPATVPTGFHTVEATKSKLPLLKRD